VLPERLVGGLVVTATVLVGHLVVLAHNRRFFYQDDAANYFHPMWQDIGRRLRDGSFPVLAPEHWMAGNYVIEAQVGLWNPVLLALQALAPSVSRLAVLAAAVAIGFGVLLGLGTYRVALAHGARTEWAAVAGAAAPFAGWTLHYDSASWTIALICTAFVAHAWASLVRYANGLSGPLPAFAWLYLDLSTGYPYGALAAGVVTLGVLVGAAFVHRSRGTLARAAGVGLAAVACAAISYLPGAASYEVTFKQAADQTFVNDGSLVLSWSEALLVVLPTHLPQMTSFGGDETVPSTYVAWFLLPALPFLRWSVLAARVRSLAGPLTVAGLMLLVAAAPAQAGPLRWPARYVVYVGLALLVLFALAASAGLAQDHLRRRALLSTGLVVVCGIRAASVSAPLLGDDHLRAGVLVLVAGAAALVALRRAGSRGGAAALLLSLPCVLALQLTVFPSNEGWEERNLPSDYAAADATFPQFPGSTLQLGRSELVPEGLRSLDVDWRTLNAGSYARGLGRDYVNAYTPVGHLAFAELLCMDYFGDTCPEARETLFERRDDGGTLADLMALDRVVLQRAQFPRAHLEAAPPGWDRVEVNDMVVVLEREGGLGEGPGGVTRTDGVEVVGAPERSDLGWRGTVRSASGGTVVLSRLAWPGYTAELDGRPLEVGQLDDIFLAVDVPAGSGELVVRYEPPGWRTGGLLALVGLLALAALAVEDRRRRR
jgi:hypothetical protein